MSKIRLKWSSLLHMTDLEFEPDAPKVLEVSEELQQTISWLTGATGHDRRLLRCNELGAILTGNGWDNLVEVETDELNVVSASPDTFTASVENKGVLIATSDEPVKCSIRRLSGGDTEIIYLSPSAMYFFPHIVYDIICAVVPDPGGTSSYVGITAYN